MSFEELGYMLRQERERRGLSVEEVAGRLKLMPRVVRAMEQAESEELPQAAYARGFVKAYGNLLEIEPELLQAGIDHAWPDDSEQASDALEPAERSTGTRKVRLAVLLSLVLMLAVAGGFWFFRDLDLRLPTDVLSKAEPAVPVKSGSPPPPAQVKNAPSPEGKNPTMSRQSSPPQVASPAQAVPPAGVGQPLAPSASADGRRLDNASGVAPQEESSPSVSSAPLQPGQHTLIIIALAECWVHSNADGTDTRQFSLRKGDTFALTFSTSLQLKLGNAGGVKLRLDGRELGAPGAAGQVKTLSFPAP